MLWVCLFVVAVREALSKDGMCSAPLASCHAVGQTVFMPLALFNPPPPPPLQ